MKTLIILINEREIGDCGQRSVVILLITSLSFLGSQGMCSPSVTVWNTSSSPLYFLTFNSWGNDDAPVGHQNQVKKKEKNENKTKEK